MAKKNRVRPPDQVIREHGEAARALGVDERTLRRWRHDPTFPNCDSGYHLEAIKKWRDENKRSGSDARDQAQQLQLALKREKVSQEEFRTRQMGLKTAEQEGQLLPRETIERAIAEIGTRSGDCLDQLPDIIRGVCSKKDQERVVTRLKQELDKWRTDLCTALESLASH